jgi:HSP20 family protein
MTAQESEEGTAKEPRDVVRRQEAFRFPSIREELDRLWDSLGGRGSLIPPYFSRVASLPPVDVFEKDGQVHVRAEVPGMKESDVHIEVTENGILITGEKREEKEIKEENYFRSERSYGRFSRNVALPPNADVDQATARFADGVLEIDMPLKSGNNRRKIEIQS